MKSVLTITHARAALALMSAAFLFFAHSEAMAEPQFTEFTGAKGKCSKFEVFGKVRACSGAAIFTAMPNNRTQFQFPYGDSLIMFSGYELKDAQPGTRHFHVDTVAVGAGPSGGKRYKTNGFCIDEGTRNRMDVGCQAIVGGKRNWVHFEGEKLK